MHLRVGTVVAARYVVEALLGAGGMAQVYRVRHARTGAEYALKVLHTPHPDLRRRMLREVQLHGAVAHPNIVGAVDALEVQGQPSLVLELVRGPALHEWLAIARPTPPQIDAIAPGLFAGLGAAHDAGLVHRDVKPANVLLAPREGSLVPKIADFGIARHLASDDVRLTRTGVAVGTPAYMAPEQVRDTHSVDARADVWSLGCVLYELVTGQRAFGSEDAFVLLDAISRAAVPPPHTLAPDAPSRWIEAIGAALQVEPARRAANCTDLARLWAAPPPGVAWAVADLERASDLFARRTLPAEDSLANLDTVDVLPPSSGLNTTAALGGGNLPAERDSFVGRLSDLQHLQDLLHQGARLVTVLGTGGTGKTRFALRFGTLHAPEWPGGVWLCDLSEARDQAGICAAVAAMLGAMPGNADPVAALGHSLAGRGRALFVLDNFEQLTAFAGATVGRWVDRAREAAFVVTSREVLGLAGEDTLSLAPLTEDDAATLFVDRAKSSHRGFDSTSGDAPVRELVRLLDRLPLAIELAAARSRMLSVDKLLARMADRFSLLARRGGGTTQRQTTLKATLDWSWDLLDPWERAALAQLSIFEGSFFLEAAETVLDLDGFSDAPWPLDALQSLVDKSLVQALPDDRFDLLVSVQAYAAQRLRTAGSFEDSGLAMERDTARRHGLHYAEYGRPEAIAALSRRGGPTLRKALAAERDNLVVALQRALDRGEPEVAVALLNAVKELVERTGPHALFAELAERALDLQGLSPEDQVWLQGALASSLVPLGRFEQAGTLLADAVSTARGLDDAGLLSNTLNEQAKVLQRRGARAEALEGFVEALSLARPGADRPLLARVLWAYGGMQRDLGETAVAHAMWTEALHLYRALGDRSREASILGLVGVAEADRGDKERARKRFRQALGVHRELGNVAAVALWQSNLASGLREAGEYDEAEAQYEKALRAERLIGRRGREGRVLGFMGELRATRGDGEGARDLLRESLAIQVETGDRRHEGYVRYMLGRVALEAGEHDEARTWLDDALLIHRANEDRGNLGLSTSLLARLERAVGRPDEALAAAQEAETVLGTDTFRWLLPDPLLSLAQLHLASGDRALALTKLEEAESILATTQAPQSSAVQSDLAALRGVLLADGGPR
ncbi:MAG: tetratricopeptide repeat protein [Deltaproteobacteria bacterium]|nr:tetratricopeptide repeat protein [Deltaproteobacteria bacterium]